MNTEPSPYRFQVHSCSPRRRLRGRCAVGVGLQVGSQIGTSVFTAYVISHTCVILYVNLYYICLYNYIHICIYRYLMILRYIFMFYFPSGSSRVRGTFAACCSVDALNSLASDKDCHSVFDDLPAVL